MNRIKAIGLGLAFSAAVVLGSCGSNNSSDNSGSGGENSSSSSSTTSGTAGDGTAATDNNSGKAAGAGNATANSSSNTAATLGNGISQEDYDKGLALVAKSDCLTCHKVSEKLVGPAYKDVAAKYKGDAATIDMLATKVIKGGAGNWGQIAMTPHPQLSKDDAKQMVKYVLALK